MNESVRPLHRQHDPKSGRLGEYFLQLGWMSPADVARVLVEQEALGLPFGQVAIRLGFIDDAELRMALAKQYSFPCFTPGSEHCSPELITALQPEHPVSEAIRRVRTQIKLRMPKSLGSRIISVVSTEQGDGRSFIAANLAMAFAQSNVRTLLIDMDFRRPRQHEIFKIGNARGLSSVLCGRLRLDQVDTGVEHDTLSVLTSGPIPPNPQEMLDARTLKPLLDAACDSYEMVIVDTPPWGACADAQLISAQTGTAIVVARRDETLQSNVAELVEAIRASGMEIIGCVMNNA